MTSSLSSQQPIHQYLSLLLSQKSNPNQAYINSVILKAISDPFVFTGFNELSALPWVQSSLNESTIGRSLLRTLDLFSNGTYLEYVNSHKNNSNDSDFVKLNEAQEMKLKLLTVVTIVQQHLDGMNQQKNIDMGHDNQNDNHNYSNMHSNVKSSRRNQNRRRIQNNTITSTSTSTSNPQLKHHPQCGIIQYSTLIHALNNSKCDENLGNTSSTRQLEDILIQCIYSNLLPPGTKLDQKHQCLIVKYSSSSSYPDTTYNNSSTNDVISSHSSTGARRNDNSDNTNSATLGSNNVLVRDINLEIDLPDMITKLEFMHKRGTHVQLTLLQALDDLNRRMKEDEEKKKFVEDQIQSSKDKVKEKMKGSGSGSGVVDMSGGRNSDGGASLWGFGSKGGKRNFKRSKAIR